MNGKAVRLQAGTKLTIVNHEGDGTDQDSDELAKTKALTFYENKVKERNGTCESEGGLGEPSSLQRGRSYRR